MSIKIVGTGSYIPDNILTNEDIEKNVKTNAKWIEDNLGIKQRRIADIDEFSSDLATISSLIAISDAGLYVEDIDFIIMVTSSPDRLSPSTACILQDKLGAYNAACIDINAVCSGFIYGLQLAKGLINSNLYKNILLVAAETYSKITDWKDRNCVFFGDGSGAVILQKDDDNLCEIDLYADGSGMESFTTPIGGTFSMIGKDVYENGVTKLPESIEKLLSRLKINKDDINHVIPHQPSIKILKETANLIGVDFSKFGISMDVYANTAGASIPITLDRVRSQHKLQKGDILLFTAIGSGWTWGSGILKWVL